MIPIINRALPTVVWPFKRIYPDLTIPDDWDSLDDFVEWYMAAEMPMVVPWDATVFRTDDATAISIFRKGRYQLELYLIHPKEIIQVHSHPGMEIITVSMGGGMVCGPEYLHGTSFRVGSTAIKLMEGEYHGGAPTGNSTGFVLLSFEKWLRDVPITSAAVQWCGPTAGPIHDELLTKYYPGSVELPGQGDVTKFTK